MTKTHQLYRNLRLSWIRAEGELPPFSQPWAIPATPSIAQRPRPGKFAIFMQSGLTQVYRVEAF